MDQAIHQSNAPVEASRRIWLWRILTASALIASVAAACSAFYELFSGGSSVNVPRITITPANPGAGDTAASVQFNIDIPTVSCLVILFSASLCIAISGRNLLDPGRAGTGIRQRFIYVGLLLLIQLIAYGVALVDLLSSAGQFG